MGNIFSKIFFIQQWPTLFLSLFPNPSTAISLELKIVPFKGKLLGVYSKHCHGFSSVQFSRSVVSDSLWPHESQHARPPCRFLNFWCEKKKVSRSLEVYFSVIQVISNLYDLAEKQKTNITNISILTDFYSLMLICHIQR